MEQYLDLEKLQATGLEIFDKLVGWLSSPQFYAQIGAIVAAVFIAGFVGRLLKKKINWFVEAPNEGDNWFRVRNYVFAASDLLFPALCFIFLGIAASVVLSAVGANWLVLLARGVAVIYLLYKAINRFITNPMLRTALIYFGIPIAALSVFNYLDLAIETLDSFAFQAGNIRLSAYFILKAAVVGAFFFWLGSISNKTGQSAIRNQDAIDRPTQELVAKMFQIVLFAGIFILLMQVLGLDLTALAVLGGAIGVGIGFGLQQIASNFISGIILLIERTLTVGDYIELDDGRAGIMKELNMRSATLETFDGKEIMVPNEKFITDIFINWTRDDPRQRYEVDFSVAFDTDIERVPDLIVKAVLEHPGVLDDPELPDCELRGFGENGVNFGLEFWIEGVDDGKNKISSDVLFIIWRTLKANNISIPFPQREVRILGDNSLMSIKNTTPKATASTSKPRAKSKS